MASLQRAMSSWRWSRRTCDSFLLFLFSSSLHSPRFILLFLIKPSFPPACIPSTAHRQYDLDGQSKIKAEERSGPGRVVSSYYRQRVFFFSVRDCSHRVNTDQQPRARALHGSMSIPERNLDTCAFAINPILQSEYSEQWSEFALLLRKNARHAEFSRGSR